MSPFRLLTPLVLSGLLAACGGGGSGSSNPVTAQPNPSPQQPTSPTPTATATAAVQSPSAASWNVASPLAVVLKTASGQAVSGPLTCSAANPTALTVAADCASVKPMRLGQQTIQVSGGGVSAAATLTVIPQMQPIGTHGVASNSGSGDYNLVVQANRTALAWGANVGVGTLGQGLNSSQLQNSALPVPVLTSAGGAALPNVAAVSAGVSNALALTAGGQVYSWGANGSRQLGRDGFPNGTAVPGLVANSANTGTLQNIVQVSMGDNNAAALADDGTVYTWGYYAGQNLTTTSDIATYPNQVRKPDGSLLANAVQISAGDGFTLALTASGQVYAWGYTNASVGGPIYANQNDTRAAVPITRADNGQPLNNIVAISAGYFVSLALDASGNVWAWGDNGSGELGQGDQNPYPGAVKVKSPDGQSYLSGIKMIAAGGFHALALDNAGNVWSWGYSQHGQLGDGPNHPRLNQGTLPAAVVSSQGSGQLTGVAAIAAGNYQSLALMPDGTIDIWGGGLRGSLGQGGTSDNDSYVPLLVKNQAGTSPLSLAPLSVYPNLLKRGIF